MKILPGILSFVLLPFALSAQSPKERALEYFSEERFDEAVCEMERAVRADSSDAECWYYLGLFNHYRAYDSRLPKGYDSAYSQHIFDCLDRALGLDPLFGDARYFYGAECSANAFVAMQRRDPQKLKYYYGQALSSRRLSSLAARIGPQYAGRLRSRCDSVLRGQRRFRRMFLPATA